MSQTKRPYPEIAPIATEVRDMLAPYTSWIEVAGSIRRHASLLAEKPDTDPSTLRVGDVELVALKTVRLWKALDDLVADGTFTRWQDVHRKERWGKRYRAIWYKGVHIDIFTADKWNRGYVYWLRTGPGDANQFMVTQIKYKAPFKIEQRYLYDSKGNRLYVPDENAWWKLLNYPTLAPHERSVTAYKKVFKYHIWKTPPHTINVRTGQISQCKHAEDFLDITVKSASDPSGKALAPTWEMVNASKSGAIPWDTYREQYLTLLRQRYAEDPALFDRLLRRDSITLGCYCADDKPCHRLIAVYVLSKLADANGVNLVYHGEYEKPTLIEQPTLF